jgi:ribonuclease-3
MRSKLVNRNRLNNLARKLGLPEMMRMDNHITSNTPNGNALEAVVGAIYIDQGFKKTYDIIIHNIFLTFLDMDEVYAEDDDYKSRILIWAQHNRHKVTFDIKNEDKGRDHLYRAILSIDGKECAQALGQSVKKAEQAASEKALAAIETKE